jgi:hypothetical protein
VGKSGGGVSTSCTCIPNEPAIIVGFLLIALIKLTLSDFIYLLHLSCLNRPLPVIVGQLTSSEQRRRVADK